MGGTTVEAGVADVLDAAREDIITTRRARYQQLERVQQLRACEAASATGYRSTRRLIQELWHLDAGEAGRLIADADSLCPTVSMTGEPIPAPLPATAAAAESGAVGEQHVRVVRRVTDHLARVDGLDSDTLEAAEQVLAQLATTLPPRALEKAAHRLVSTLDPDGAAPPEDPELGDEVLIGKRRDGSLALNAHLHGTVETEMILEVLDALSVPAGPDDDRSLARRRAEALKDLFAQAVSPTGIATEQKNADTADEPVIPAQRPPADEPSPPSPGCPSVAARGQALLTITIDHRWLTQRIGHGVLDSDTPVTPEAARRWACDAAVVPMVLGSRSEPLDIGRLTRTVPDGMRRALIVRDGGCAFPGCTRRPRRCHAHHLRHWADGGDTDHRESGPAVPVPPHRDPPRAVVGEHDPRQAVVHPARVAGSRSDTEARWTTPRPRRRLTRVPGTRVAEKDTRPPRSTGAGPW